MLNDSEVERILVVVAHPDDVEFGAAGTVANWTDTGIEVSFCIVTDGDAGGFDPAVPRHEIGGIRRAEQRNAAKIIGVPDTITQAALLAVAYFTGTDFKPAKRLPAKQLTHWEQW